MDEAAAALLRGDDAKRVLAALRGLLGGGTVLPGAEDASGKDAAAGISAEGAALPEPFGVLIKQIGEQTGLRGKKLYLPIRAALTGRLHGPELDRIFALLSLTLLRKRV